MKINLRVVSIAVAVCLGMLGAVQLAAPESLGITPVAARWLGIIATGLGVLATFLPRVTGPTTDPEALADRVWTLSDEDRQRVLDELEQRRREQRILDVSAEIERRHAAAAVDPTTPAGRAALDADPEWRP